MTTIYRRDRSARPDRTPNPRRLPASAMPLPSQRWLRNSLRSRRMMRPWQTVIVARGRVLYGGLVAALEASVAGGDGLPGPDPDADRPLVIDYSESWPARATSLIIALRARLGDSAQRIEHIGSTAIPGMAAKDVLDLQVSVASLHDAAHDFDAPLASLGFRLASHESYDHVPAGLAGGPGQWAKRLWARRSQPGGDVNLHVRRRGPPTNG